jgi:microcystin-dependent protein
MAEPFLGEIKIIAWNYPPKGWAFCNGQLLPINQNQALFSILGTTYGGDGRVNFGLPDFRGRVPLYQGQGFIEGEKGGQEFHTLIQSEMAGHTHFVNASNSNTGASNVPIGNIPCTTNIPTYNTTPNTNFNAAEVSSVGGSQPHENRQPYLVLNFIIALQGIFPSRN